MITMVSGLPHAGTSLMMQMRVAGGSRALADAERQADAENPRGYLEWERIKQLPTHPACIAEAEGKVLKIISRLLLSLPPQREYRIVFMQRHLPEGMASQDEMLRRRGTYNEETDPALISFAFEKHLEEVYSWLDLTSQVKTLYVSCHDVLHLPGIIGQRTVEFLGIDLNSKAMSQQGGPVALPQPFQLAD